MDPPNLSFWQLQEKNPIRFVANMIQNDKMDKPRFCVSGLIYIYIMHLS